MASTALAAPAPPPSTARRAVVLLAGAVWFVSAVVYLAVDPGPGGAQIVANGAFVAVGALLILRRRGNVVGPLLIGFGLPFSLALALDAAAVNAAEMGDELLAGWLALIGGALFPLGATLLVPVILYFPNGPLPSKWSRRFLLGTVIFIPIFTVLVLLSAPTSTTNPDQSLVHPFLDRATAESILDAAEPLVLVVVLLMLIAIASLVVKWRRGDAVERRQIGWFGLAGLAYAVIAGVNTAFQQAGAIGGDWFLFIDAVGVILIPLAIGVAIMRYRLYDLDAIVSKSVTYLGLAAMITLLYTAVVVGPLLFVGFPDEGGPGPVPVIAAAAVVAVVFDPLRSGLQRRANRLVYGERATPHEVISRITSSLSAAAPGTGLSDLAQLLAEGTGAERAIVWLGSGERLRSSGSFPLARRDGTAPDDEDLTDVEFAASHPVLHRGEQFGALSIRKAPNDPITPTDRELLADVAAGAGLLLRNISLNDELEQRAREISASRHRLITAQDAERRRLERDLHDGAQQQVVALKVKLGIARTIAEREGVEAIASGLAALADETQGAVDSLREVAHGIYPPLLESDGLEAALRTIERDSSTRVVVVTNGLDRYEHGFEQTVFFCVLGLVECARMAGAGDVAVKMAEDSGNVTVQADVSDCVTPVDLTAVIDRIDTAEGTIERTELDGGGLQIIAKLPTRHVTLEPA